MSSIEKIDIPFPTWARFRWRDSCPVCLIEIVIHKAFLGETCRSEMICATCGSYLVRKREYRKDEISTHSVCTR